jgi:sarcosine oxidase subunit beta
MSATPYDVIVIGGGIHGCAAALHLARAQRRVLVLEKDYVARHASGVYSGGVRTLGRHPAELPLALEARRCWLRIAELVGDDCGFRAVGCVRVAENEADLAKLRERSAAVAALELDHAERVIGQHELRERVPALAPHCVGALCVDEDGYAEPYRATAAFRRAAQALGARVIEGAEVCAAQRTGTAWTLATRNGVSYATPWVVNCAGGWGDRVARLLGDAIPLSPRGSMQIVTARLPRFVLPVVSSASRPLSLKQFGNGTVVIGGGQRAAVQRDSNASDLDARGLARAAAAAVGLFPLLRQAMMVRAWSGIEGFTEDSLPVIGAGGKPGVFHAFGFSGHGFQLGPAVGRLIAEYLTTGGTCRSLEAFSPWRFATAALHAHAAA